MRGLSLLAATNLLRNVVVADGVSKEDAACMSGLYTRECAGTGIGLHAIDLSPVFSVSCFDLSMSCVPSSPPEF
jgi:hypothetical protein